MQIEVVVARYCENISWVGNLPRGVRATVYDKGGSGTGHTLPNIGREAHTYFFHIVQHYENLAPVTVFVQGHPFDHAPDLHKLVRGWNGASELEHGFFWLGFILDTDTADGGRLFRAWSKNLDGRGLDMKSLFSEVFGVEEAPDVYRFKPGGQFAASADVIRQRPREFYEKCLEQSVAFPDAAHCFERLWDRVFCAPPIGDEEMCGDLTRYLKKVKRLETPLLA